MAQILKQVIGHETVLARLQPAVRGERFFPVYLFVGPESVGKSLVARGLVQVLLCETGSGCGECASCLKVATGAHESLLAITTETTSIKIDQAGQILSFLRLQTWQGRRCIIVDDAATLTPAAANTLLKTLEEPPAQTYFFLITHSLHAVLPTIRSRAQTVRFQALRDVELLQILPQAPEWVRRSSTGRVSCAQQLMDEDTQSLRRAAADILQAQLNGQRANVREKLAALSLNGEQALFVVQLWRQMVRDLRVAQCSSSIGSIHGDLINTEQPFSVRQLDQVFADLLTAEQDLVHHVDKNLVLENFAFAGGAVG